jgi:hypothetical protein
LTVLAGGLAAQQPPAGKPADFVAARPRQQAPSGGLLCHNINYYGVADQVPVPGFDGVTSSGWVGAVSYAYGGIAQFLPPTGSPPCAAVFLNGQTNYINFPTPTPSVSYVHATDYATTVTAHDVNNNRKKHWQIAFCEVGLRLLPRTFQDSG